MGGISLDAKAIAQATVLNEAARLQKQAARLMRESLHLTRQVQAELNGIEVETVKPPIAQGAEDDSNENEAQAA